jgi:outer membrane protein assembly factor BamA
MARFSCTNRCAFSVRLRFLAVANCDANAIPRQRRDDVRSEVEDIPDRPNKKTVIFIIGEKPIVASIDYQGIKSITESGILAAWKDQKVALSVGSWFDETKAKRAATVISKLLASHGHPSASMNPTYERMPSSSTVTLVCNIDEGAESHK